MLGHNKDVPPKWLTFSQKKSLDIGPFLAIEFLFLEEGFNFIKIEEKKRPCKNQPFWRVEKHLKWVSILIVKISKTKNKNSQISCTSKGQSV